MARPKKNNAEYFTHDADMRNDVKIKALRRKFHHKGYAVWCFMLEVLTHAEHFETCFDETSKELLAADFDVNVEELEQIIDYCHKIDLFQIKDGYISSDNHRERFNGLVEKRNRDRERFARRQEAWERQREQKLQEEIGDISDNENVAEISKDDNSRSDNSYSKEKINKNTNQRQTKKQTKIQTKDISNKDIYPYQDIVATWNEVCKSLPQVKSLNDNRRKKIRCRLDEWGKKTDWLETARELFAMVEASDFLSGRNGKWSGCSFDWFFANGENWLKVSEGNYTNKGGKSAQYSNIRLGEGERIEDDGRRTYGTGRATIPHDAPPRPSSTSYWDECSQSWIS